MTDERALITHDTYRIISANKRACELFRCDEDDIVDRSTVDAIHGDDFKGLVQLRFKVIRESGDLPPQKLPFTRLDGSRFWAEVQTRRVSSDLFETEIDYLYEY